LVFVADAAEHLAGFFQLLLLEGGAIGRVRWRQCDVAFSFPF
jgi:hypothetical protein